MSNVKRQTLHQGFRTLEHIIIAFAQRSSGMRVFCRRILGTLVHLMGGILMKQFSRVWVSVWIAVLVSFGVMAPTVFAKPAQSQPQPPGAPQPADTMVGTAVVDITPSQPVYLGGYGFGPERMSTGVLNPLQVHVLAIRSHHQTLVIGSIDSQGYFDAYQSGAYGLLDVAASVSAQTAIPEANILFSSIHSHAAPDTVGIWGAVPTSYLQQVHDACIKAAIQAVKSLQPAKLYTGEVNTQGLSTSFTADNQLWPRDQELRVLVAKTPQGHVLATMVNYGVHPTVLPRENTRISPDWPAATEAVVSQSTNGAFAMVLIGDLGRTWPAFPANVQVPLNSVDQMNLYGNLVALQALKAISASKPLPNTGFAALSIPIAEKVTTGALLPLYQAGLLLRSAEPGSFYQETVYSSVTEFKLGPDVLYGMPAEPYPDLVFELERTVHAPITFVAGLANDQLGYAAPARAYAGIVANSPTDEAQFVINPQFGDDIVAKLVAGAKILGFR